MTPGRSRPLKDRPRSIPPPVHLPTLRGRQKGEGEGKQGRIAPAIAILLRLAVKSAVGVSGRPSSGRRDAARFHWRAGSCSSGLFHQPENFAKAAIRKGVAATWATSVRRLFAVATRTLSLRRLIGGKRKRPPEGGIFRRVGKVRSLLGCDLEAATTGRLAQQIVQAKP